MCEAVMSPAHLFFLSSDSRTGTIPEELGRLVCLTILDLSWNEMEGKWALGGLPLIMILRSCCQSRRKCVPAVNIVASFVLVAAANGHLRRKLSTRELTFPLY